MLSYKNQINFVVRENILSWKRKHDDAVDDDDKTDWRCPM